MTNGLAIKTLYGVGEVGNSIRGVLNGVFVFFFYTSVMGLPGTLVGIASGIVLIWDALIDPYIGHLSDRANLGLGRRHGFMLAGALTIGFATWALFSPPRGMSTPLLFGWFFVVTVLSRLTGALFQIPYYALGAELASEYHERTVLTGIRGMWALVGSVAAASLSLLLFFPNVSAGEDPKLNYGGYPIMGLALGAAMAVTALVAIVATRRQAAEQPVPGSGLLTEKRASGPGRNPFAFVEASTIAFRIPAFRVLFVSFALIFLGTVINSVLSTHFFTYYAGIVESKDLSLVRGTFYVTALLGIPVWLTVGRSLEKRQLYLVATVATMSVIFSAFVLVGNGRLFGTGDPRPLLVGQAIAGAAAGLFWVIPPSMLADVADQDALTTGQNHNGLIFGLLSLGTKLITGLSLLIAGVLIDQFAGLVPGQAEQSALTIERIGILFCLVPAALMVIGGGLILLYPLDRARVAAIQSALGAD